MKRKMELKMNHIKTNVQAGINCTITKRLCRDMSNPNSNFYVMNGWTAEQIAAGVVEGARYCQMAADNGC